MRQYAVAGAEMVRGDRASEPAADGNEMRVAVVQPAPIQAPDADNGRHQEACGNDACDAALHRAPAQTKGAERRRQQKVGESKKTPNGVDIAAVTDVIMGFGYSREHASRASAMLFGEQQLDTNDKDDELLTPTQLCERVKASSTTIWRDKEIPFVIVGQRKRFCLREVMAHFAAKAQGRKAIRKRVGKKVGAKAEVSS